MVASVEVDWVVAISAVLLAGNCKWIADLSVAVEIVVDSDELTFATADVLRSICVVESVAVTGNTTDTGFPWDGLMES